MLLRLSVFISSLLTPVAQSTLTRPTTPVVDGGTPLPAALSWGDFDGDGRLDLAAVTGTGGLRILRGQADMRFEDVTERVGLPSVEEAGLAIWGDYDADGKLDLFVGALTGASRLLHNEGGSFLDMSEGSGLVCADPVHAAEWLDLDGDGRLDLFVTAGDRSLLFHGMEGGFFESSELPLGSRPEPSLPQGRPMFGPGAELAGPEGTSGPVAGAGSIARTAPRSVVAPTGGGTATLVTPPHLPTACAVSIRDQANPGTCLQASSSPTLGELYPLSSNLFVAVSGEVGIGTTSPTARLHVAGTARVTDTLTLAPSGDVALNVSTGSIYKEGRRFIHTEGPAENLALGFEALSSNTSGTGNTAAGYNALHFNSNGMRNTAIGGGSLWKNTSGSDNTAAGFMALNFNVSGNDNSAFGAGALETNTIGFANTAFGSSALSSNIGGLRNTAVGVFSMGGNASGSDNVAFGHEALGVATAANENSAFGAGAMKANTSGSGNTAVGRLALGSSTTGGSNAALGNRAMFSNTAGSRNIACGARTLFANSVGNGNSAIGYAALYSNTSGESNVASGDAALFSNTSGIENTAVGVHALYANAASSGNTAVGARALSSSTGAGNSAFGRLALSNLTTGARNLAIGAYSGGAITTGSDNIAIGSLGGSGESGTIRLGGSSQTRAFVSGVRGVTTGLANGIPVLVDSNGQLGTVSSSRRFKDDIRDMGDATASLLELRPVLFRYKQEQTLPNGQEVPPEYGLIAEEVAEIMPDLVVYDEEGKPFTVKYHMLSSMLLNELEKLRKDHDAACEELAALRDELKPLRSLEERVRALESAGGAH